ncbi:MAG: SGNH/GDSL hydrolase family protein, partial [Verrucomicrobiota bacterium]
GGAGARAPPRAPRGSPRGAPGGAQGPGAGEVVKRFVSEPVEVGSFSPVAVSCYWRSTGAVRGSFTCESEEVRSGKTTPLWFPATADGEWARVTFFVRTCAGATSATVRVGVPEGIEAEMADFEVEAVSEEAFGVAWAEWRGRYPVREWGARPGDGANLALFVEKLRNEEGSEEPLLVYGIGSSYTNMLGNGERLVQWVREHFPNAPPVVYKKHVGSAVNYDFTRGWMRQLVLGERPDLVILYSGGEAEDLETLLADFRAHSTADVIVASLHLRERDVEITEETVNAPEWDAVREVALKYGCEWVDNRREWAAYLEEQGKPIEWLLKDAVHQTDHGALVINENIVRHVRENDEPGYETAERERFLSMDGTGGREGEGIEKGDAGEIRVRFRGNRLDVVGRSRQGGGVVTVEVDGVSGEEVDAFLTTLIVPGAENHRPERGSTADRAPHLVGVGEDVVPQEWTIRMTSDGGDYELEGSETGLDGEGNNGEDFVSESGQVEIPTALWRRRLEADGTHSNRTGDTFTWEVYRSAVGEVSFEGDEGGVVEAVVVENLEKGWHEVVLRVEGAVEVLGVRVFEPGGW